jgi:nitrate/nitrite-specific signal transduction histidine kinase
MLRRTLLLSATALALPTWAQVQDLNDAINKAGRQRMLSQRMGKAWLALVHGIEPTAAQAVLDKSMALFDRQLVELKAYAPHAELRDTYQKLEAAWSDHKAALVGAAPAKTRAAALLAADARVLALAHQGTVQYEATLGKPVGKLVNVAGRQRMLSQRMAKFYLAATLPVDADTATAEIAKARTEFVGAQEVLRQAPEATPRIKEALQLADGQWVFFDAALQRLQNTQRSTKLGADVFVSSENLLSVMDTVTGLYAAVKI